MGYFDRADWHSGGDYPPELPPENGGTHIGFFLAWSILHDLISDLHRDESIESVCAVKERRMTGREFLFEECDEKFGEMDLSDVGNRFAREYYEASYFGDYAGTLGEDVPTIYHITDTWDNYDKIEPVISARFHKWMQKNTPS